MITNDREKKFTAYAPRSRINIVQTERKYQPQTYTRIYHVHKAIFFRIHKLEHILASEIAQ